ncbi:MAG: DUF2264 domain-containing protein [Verrucomicrobia bacterium]|nr:DUF2264 domain-containing protein [Verrucomicrobiota bacterium]MCH8511884.1 DUF2264 domain-containing protein [Kiritimatiellia bacterium]
MAHQFTFSGPEPDDFANPGKCLTWARQFWEPERLRLTAENPAVPFVFPRSNGMDRGIAMEAWSRPLWLLLPAALGCKNRGEALPDWLEAAISSHVRAFVDGCDPDHPDYWGETGDQDQCYVEMAVLGVAMCVLPERFGADFSQRVRDQVIAWLTQIHDHAFPPNNWHFFRCFVTLGLLRLTQDLAETYASKRVFWAEIFQRDLRLLDSFYLGDGWYEDGEGGMRDYYNPFGFHTYALTLHALCPDDPILRRFRERTATFLPDYAAFFDASGAAIPFGRSMTYRFAQGSLFAACICFDLYAEVSPELPAWLDLSYMKTMLFRHLSQWMKYPIFTESGRLSVGYGYPNPQMAEEYNAHGSPGWGFKTFWFLSLSDEHPFWSAPLMEDPLPPGDGIRALPRMPAIAVRNEGGAHAFFLNAGQLVQGSPRWFPKHGEDKYAKLVYSSRFAFGVSVAPFGFNSCAIDSTLAVSMDGEHWMTRARCRGQTVTENSVRSIWRPWVEHEIEIETELIPEGAGHLRAHRIRASRSFFLCEGGFACPVDVETVETVPDGAWIQGGGLFSGVRALQSEGSLEVTEAGVHLLSPCSHLLFPRARVPFLRTTLHAGQSVLRTACYGGLDGVGGLDWLNAFA